MPARTALVIQASFAPGSDPRAAKAAAEPEARAASSGKPEARATDKSGRPPHPATVAQKKAAPPAPAKRPPHPATSAQAKAAPAGKQERPPHPATIVQKKATPPGPAKRPPHPATVSKSRKAAQPALEGAAFQAPPGLLQMGLQLRGKPLPETIQRAMADRFGGADFSDVRVHEGKEAASIGALALTAGDHLFFAPGQYRPETKAGRALIGKQLAYVVQQRDGRVQNPFGKGLAVVQDPALDAEAAEKAR